MTLEELEMIHAIQLFRQTPRNDGSLLLLLAVAVFLGNKKKLIIQNRIGEVKTSHNVFLGIIKRNDSSVKNIRSEDRSVFGMFT